MNIKNNGSNNPHVNDITNGAKTNTPNKKKIPDSISPASYLSPSHQSYKSSKALSLNHLFLKVSIRNTTVDIYPKIIPVVKYPISISFLYFLTIDNSSKLPR